MIKKVFGLILFTVLMQVSYAQDYGFLVRDSILIKPVSFELKPITNSIDVQYLDSLYNIHTKKIIYRDTRNLKVEPGLRYLTESLRDYSSNDMEFLESIEELSKYARNDSVRYMANYLVNYIKSTSRREKAIKKISEQLRKDSLEYSAYKHLPKNKYNHVFETKAAENKDVSELLHFVKRDSSYKWIRKISRDSVLLSLKNASNDSLKLWVKNGRESIHRFWIKNAQNDSIGSWVQTKPDNSLKIIVDYDVYQQSRTDNQHIIKQPPIVIIDTNVTKIGELYPYKWIDTKWRYASTMNIGLTQGMHANWKEGGENSVSGLLDIDAFANYKYKGISWDNTLKYRYGLMQSGDEQTKKTEDLFELNSKVGVKFYNDWYFSTMLNFKTQLFKGYDYLEGDKKDVVSAFMSPAYILLSLGLDYKPSSNLSVLISPFTGKYTIVSNTDDVDPVKFGIKEGESIKREVGSYVKTIHKWQIVKDINLNNEMGLFYSYEGADELDVDWKTTLEMKVNYFISTRIFTHVLYDRTVSKKFQFKEILNIGVTYNF